MKATICILALLCLFGCSRDDKDILVGYLGNPFLMADSDTQAEALRRMESLGIPYEINNLGYVSYLLKNSAEVYGIRRKAQYGEGLNPYVYESASIPNAHSLAMYELTFTNNGIPYKLEKDGGWYVIHWSQKYGLEVDKLRQDIEFEILSNITKKL